MRSTQPWNQKDLIVSRSCVSTKIVCNCTTKGDKSVFHFPYCTFLALVYVYSFGNGINLSVSGSCLQSSNAQFFSVHRFYLLFQYVHRRLNRTERWILKMIWLEYACECNQCDLLYHILFFIVCKSISKNLMTFYSSCLGHYKNQCGFKKINTKTIQAANSQQVAH